jgi:hypothetical protein
VAGSATAATKAQPSGKHVCAATWNITGVNEFLASRTQRNATCLPQHPRPSADTSVICTCVTCTCRLRGKPLGVCPSSQQHIRSLAWRRLGNVPSARCAAREWHCLRTFPKGPTAHERTTFSLSGRPSRFCASLRLREERRGRLDRHRRSELRRRSGPRRRGHSSHHG